MCHKNLFKWLIGLSTLALVLGACGPTPTVAPTQPAPVTAAAPTQFDSPIVPQLTVPPAPTEAPNQAQPPVIQPAVPQEKISDHPEGKKEILVEVGQRFEYWSYQEQKWIEFKLVSLNPTVINMPMYLQMAYDGLAMKDTVGYPSQITGFVSYFWYEAEGGKLNVSSGDQRLKISP